MNNIIKFICTYILFVCSFYTDVKGQDVPVYYNYFNYQYIYNPAFLGAQKFTEVDLLYRQQWANIDGSPEFIHAGLQLPLSNNVATGLYISDFKRGLLETITAMGSVAYTAEIGMNSTISFGISAGASRTSIDTDQITDFSDPALANALDKSFNLEGQAGLSLNVKNLSIGVSLASIFERRAISDEDFQEINLDPLSNSISSLAYKINIGPDFLFEPMIVYKYSTDIDDQIQGYGTFYYNQFLWLGGSYTKDYGVGMHAGLNVNQTISIGYAYESRSETISNFGEGTHEFLIKINFGRQKVNRHEEVISNITSEIEPPQQANEKIVEEETVNEEPAAVEEAQPEKPTEEIVEEEKPPVREEQPVPEPQVETPEEQQPLVIEEKPPVETETIIENESGLEPGFYVVVGSFKGLQNANKYQQQLANAQYPSQIGYNKITHLNYVYVYYGQDQQEAINKRDQFRKSGEFEFGDSWILHIN